MTERIKRVWRDGEAHAAAFKAQRPTTMTQYSAGGRKIRSAPFNVALRALWQKQVPYGTIKETINHGQG